MKKTEYLEYIGVLYERLLSKHKRTGVTTWALIIGTIYLIWQIIPSIYEIRNSPEQLRYVALVLHYLQFGVISIFVFVKVTLRNNDIRSSPFDNRIVKTDKSMSIIMLLILIIILVVSAIYSGRLSLSNISDLSWYQILLIEINSWIFGLLAGFVLFVLSFIKIYRRITGNPAPIEITNLSETKFVCFMNWAIIISLLVLGILNFHTVASILFDVARIKSQNIPLLSFNISLLIFALVILVYRKQDDDQIYALTRLERDIILHGIKVSEIKERLKEEYLGHEIGEWLTEKYKDIQKEAENYSKILLEVDEFFLEIKKLPKDHEYEKKGRIDKYLAKIESKANNYSQTVKRLNNWLEIAVRNKSIMDDKYLFGLLEDKVKLLKKLVVNVEEKSKKALAKVRKLV